MILAASGAAGAGELDADETQALLVQGPWTVGRGAGQNHFIWHSDGTLCVKIHDPDAEACDDTGTWVRDGTEVCYELQWWGKAYDVHKACFRVVESEPGAYEAVDTMGLTLLQFTTQDPG